ncbi:hypothetical protein [Sphingomonas sp.]|jgi:hypothetical protein|uniref:hypothetical protein n=1 Tax=Sphingomonas sp. TaxID=28214 RepID=UPI0035C87173
MALPHARLETPSTSARELEEEDAPDTPGGSPAHELQFMLQRHYGARADLPAPSQSRVLELVNPVIEQMSRLAGVAAFALALAGVVLLIW